MELKGKKITVVGLGKSGIAAARYLLKKGAVVTVSDLKTELELGAVAAEVRELGARMSLGFHDAKIIESAEMVVLSPGVSNQISGITSALARGAPVIGEMELALTELSRPVIAVTGTNGKTTTTALIGHLLESAGVNVCVAGNIGAPLLDALEDAGRADYVVLEVSSFQIETTPSLKAQIGILLNVTPDHLDRHATFEAYAQCKARLIERIPEKGWGIYNAADRDASRFVLSAHCGLIPFDATGRRIDGRGLPQAAWFGEGDLVVRVSKDSENRYPLAKVGLEGIHNRENMLAALAACELCGADSHELLRGLESFKGLPHRLELVGEYRGIRYYDDSKGTNIGATIRAIEGFAEPIILIAGGISKGVDFAPLALQVAKRVKKAILIGESAPLIQEAFKGHTETVRAKTMTDAVRFAAESANPGDVVLLSPACASFDMFRDYAHRGEEFAMAVKKIAGEE